MQITKLDENTLRQLQQRARQHGPFTDFEIGPYKPPPLWARVFIAQMRVSVIYTLELWKESLPIMEHVSISAITFTKAVPPPINIVEKVLSVLSFKPDESYFKGTARHYWQVFRRE